MIVNTLQKCDNKDNNNFMHVAVFVTKIRVKAITSLKTGVPLDCEYNFSSYLTENIIHFKYKNQLINLLQGNMKSLFMILRNTLTRCVANCRAA